MILIIALILPQKVLNRWIEHLHLTLHPIPSSDLFLVWCWEVLQIWNQGSIAHFCAELKDLQAEKLEDLEEEHKKELDEATKKWKEKIAKAEVGRL